VPFAFVRSFEQPELTATPALHVLVNVVDESLLPLPARRAFKIS
jgi:hypothetical protein